MTYAITLVRISQSTRLALWMALFAGALSSSSARGQTEITYGGGTGLFNVAGSWTPAVAPNASTQPQFIVPTPGFTPNVVNFNSTVATHSMVIFEGIQPVTFRPESSLAGTITYTLNNRSVTQEELNIVGNGARLFRLVSNDDFLAGSPNSALEIRAGATYVQQGGQFYLGNFGIPASLTIVNGGQFQWTSSSLVGMSVRDSVITVSGSGSSLSAMDERVDLEGNSTLRVGSGGSVAVRTLHTTSSDLLHVDGGTLHIVNSIVGDGRLAFSRGTLRFGFNVSTALESLRGGAELSTFKTLIVDDTFTVRTAGRITMNGGTLDVGQLSLQGGAIQGPNSLNLATSVGDNRLTGFGTVLTRVGGNAASEIVATGALVLGDLILPDGYAFPGILRVGGQQVILFDSTRAELGVSTTLSSGGRLSAPNGMNLSAGETLSATGNASIQGDFTNNGTINGPVGVGQLLSFSDNVDGAGDYTGNIAFLQDFSPGNSPASVQFDDNLTLTNSAKLVLELGGLSLGTQHDHVEVSGVLTLGGELAVSLINGFQPSFGDDFTLMIYDSRSGSFSSLDLPTLSPGLIWDLDYGVDTLTLSVTSLPGDIDQDGDVDPADAALFTSHLGLTTGSVWTTGDFNGDGATTLADLALLQGNFGQIAPPSPAAVPEPSTELMALTVVALGFLSRRRHATRLCITRTG